MHPFFRALYDRISGALTYPSPIVEAGREGEVSLRFAVDRQGVLRGDFSEIRAEDRVLKVHILQCLRKALDHALPGAALTDRASIEITATFRFAVVPRKDVLPPSPPEIAKNDFFFERSVIDPRESENALAGGFYGGQAAANDHSQSAAIYRKWRIDKNAVASVESNTGNQGIGLSVDPVRLFKWVFGSKKTAVDPLERYKSNPDY